jgi:hypothetical protein
MNILGALTAYCIFTKNPSLNLKTVNDDQLFLNFATELRLNNKVLDSQSDRKYFKYQNINAEYSILI